MSAKAAVHAFASAGKMTSEWQFDRQHSCIQFMVRHLLVAKVRGRFTRWSGSFRFSEANPAQSAVEVRIDAGSIDTSEAQRDAHLRSADFFDVARHPTITFKSTRIDWQGSMTYRVVGDLTIREIGRAHV